jgi:hypothetical protein
MPMKFSLNPTSTGEVYMSTYHAIIPGNTLPTTLLPRSHPFRKFWTNHLAALCEPGLFDTVIDALVALAERDEHWREKKGSKAIDTRRRQMRQFFKQHPPNIVVVSGAEDYGFHLRTATFWPFIHISEEIVNFWKDADRSSERGLGLTALIAASIDHELGHWIFTLVSSKQNIVYPFDF